jgi:hypothetical protein
VCVAVAPRGVVVVAEFDDAFEFRVVVVVGASRAAASDASSNAGIAGGPRRAPRRDDARARVRRVASASSNAKSRVDIDRSRARARRARRRVIERATKTPRDPRRRRAAHARRMARASGDDARDRRRSFRCRDVVDAVVDGDDGARARVVNVNGVARVEVSSRAGAGAGARAGRVGPVDALRAACACATAATFESRNAREAAEGARAVRAMLALVRMVCERRATRDEAIERGVMRRTSTAARGVGASLAAHARARRGGGLRRGVRVVVRDEGHRGRDGDRAIAAGGVRERDGADADDVPERGRRRRGRVSSRRIRWGIT